MRTIKGTDLLKNDFYAIVNSADGFYAIPDYEIEKSSLIDNMVNVPVSVGILYLDMDHTYEVVDTVEELFQFIRDFLTRNSR